jgi:hypothetical protein
MSPRPSNGESSPSAAIASMPACTTERGMAVQYTFATVQGSPRSGR